MVTAEGLDDEDVWRVLGESEDNVEGRVDVEDVVAKFEVKEGWASVARERDSVRSDAVFEGLREALVRIPERAAWDKTDDETIARRTSVTEEKRRRHHFCALRHALLVSGSFARNPALGVLL